MPVLKTCVERPPLSISWLAHENDNITSLTCGCHSDVVYIVIGTTGGRVSVFSLGGQCVGEFHEVQMSIVMPEKLFPLTRKAFNYLLLIRFHEFCECPMALL